MIGRVLAKLDKQVNQFGAPYVAVGIYELINYITIFPWWFSQFHNFKLINISHIIIFLIMSILLIGHKYWPESLQKVKPLFLYISIFFMFPYMSFFYYMKSPTSLVSTLDVMLALFILILVVDWISFIVLIILALITTYAIRSIFYTPPHIQLNEIYTPIFTFCWTIFLGAVFSRNATRHRKNLQLEKQLSAIKSVMASVAHELRTPLLSIRSGAVGIKMFMPKFIQAYKAAEQAQLDVPKIYSGEIQHINRVIDNIDSEVNHSNTVIDTLLTNSNKNMINPEIFNTQSMGSCINAAIIRYPFNPKEQIKLIHLDTTENFNFHGDDLLMIHIIFNLLKNAFYVIAEMSKGEVFIRLEKGDRYNRLYFKDTAKGLDKNQVNKLFDTFYSDTPNNTGIGLSYCKLAMESFNGQIDVRSAEGEYTEFILEFPKKAK